MAKPSTPVAWATDAAYTADADPWASAANKVDPGATRRAEGAEPDTFPAEWYNYMQNSLGEHVEYIEGVLETSDSIPAVTRTLYVSPALCDGGSFFARPRNYVTVEFRETLGAAGTADRDISPYIPPGAEVTEIEFVVNTANAEVMTCELQERIPNYATGAPGTWTTIRSNQSTTTPGNEIVALTGGASWTSDVRWDPAASLYRLRAIGSVTGGDVVTAVRITYKASVAPSNEVITFDTTDGDRRALYKRDTGASNEARSAVVLPLSRVLPHGATLTQVRALVRPGAARATAADRMDVGLYRNTGRDFGTPALGTTSLIGSETTDDGTAALQTLDLTGLTEVMDSVDSMNVVLRSSSVADMIEDEFFGLELQFTDPGPRNF